MKLITKQLHSALAEVGKIIKTRTTMPAASCVKLSMTEDDRLEISATNTESWISRRIDADGAIGTVLVNYQVFRSLIDGIMSESFHLTLDGSKLTIRKPNGSLVVKTMDAAEFPSTPTDKGKPLAVNLEDLAEGIEATAWAANRDQTAKALALCVLIDMQPTELACAATTLTRFAFFRKPSVCETRTLMLPAAMSGAVIPLMREKGSGAFLSENMFHVEAPTGSITVKLIALAQPWPYKQFIEARGKDEGIFLNREALLANCRTALATSDSVGHRSAGNIKILRVGASDNVTVTLVGCKNADGDEEIEASGGPIDVLLPADQLAEALSKSSDENVRIILSENAAYIEDGSALLHAIGKCRPKTELETTPSK